MLTKDRVLFQVSDEGEEEPYYSAVFVEGPACSPMYPEPCVDLEIGSNGMDWILGEDAPKELGFYVWEGVVIYSGPDWEGEYDIEFDGDIRPATDEDWAEFEVEHLLTQELYEMDFPDDYNEVKE